MTNNDRQFPTGDRDLDCAAWLRDGVDALIATALAAGWSEDEVGNALLSLAQDRITEARDNAVLGPSGATH